MLTRIIKTYSEQILKRYEEKGVLLEPTRTDIKDKCIARFLEENHPRDEEFLRLFFKANRKDDLLKIIENTDPEKFRTVQNFLLRNTGSTSKRNLNLIAWLIDFQPRPYSFYRKQEAEENNGGDSGVHIQIKTNPTEKEDTDDDDSLGPVIINIRRPSGNSETKNLTLGKDKKQLNYQKRIWITASSIMLFVCLFYGINYMIQHSQTTKKIPIEKDNLTNTNQKCMAWNGHKYELTNCTDSIHPNYNTKVIAFDKSLQKNFKKVSVSIETKFFAPNNKTPLIWYYKLGKGKFEYYTSHGIHPVNGEPLEDITKYHIDKYIPKHTPAESSFMKED